MRPGQQRNPIDFGAIRSKVTKVKCAKTFELTISKNYFTYICATYFELTNPLVQTSLVIPLSANRVGLDKELNIL